MPRQALGVGIINKAGKLWKGLRAGGALASRAEITTGDTLVYRSFNAASETQYVGITDSFARREAQHASRFFIDRINGLSNLSRADARAVEQVLIEHYGLAKNGGTLVNKINSIAKGNPIYTPSMARGVQILHDIGYPGF